MEEVKIKNKIIIAFLIIALLISVAYIIYTEVNKEACNCNDCPPVEKLEKNEDSSEESVEEPEIGSYPNLYTKNLSKENIITLFNRYIHVNGLVYEPYLEEINYEKVIYIGYNGNEKYYKITGNYTCNTTEISCYYSPQDSDESIKDMKQNFGSGIIVFEKDIDNDKYVLKNLYSYLSPDDYTEVNEEIN